MNAEQIAQQLEALAAAVRRLSTPTPEPPPTPSHAMVWDARLTQRGVTCFAEPSPYALIEARYLDGDEAQGKHHILFDVQNRDGSRKVGANIIIGWPDGAQSVVTEAKPGERYGGNFPMFAAGNSYTLAFAGWRVAGMGLGTIAEPHRGHHVCYAFVWRER